MQSQSHITVSVEELKQLCTTCVDVVGLRYRERLAEIDLEPEKREKFIRDRGMGRFRKWFWMSSDDDFQARLRRARRQAREQFTKECELPMKLYRAVSDQNIAHLFVELSVEDHHYLVQWLGGNHKSPIEPEWDL